MAGASGRCFPMASIGGDCHYEFSVFSRTIGTNLIAFALQHRCRKHSPEADTANRRMAAIAGQKPERSFLGTEGNIFRSEGVRDMSSKNDIFRGAGAQTASGHDKPYRIGHAKGQFKIVSGDNDR